MDSLVKEVKKIEMPDDMRERILEKCYKESSEIKVNKEAEMRSKIKLNKEIYNEDKMNSKMEKRRMSIRSKNKFFKQPLTVAATLVLCVCITGATSLAATGKLQGYFKDITNWNGAITGTTYEQATEEITVSLEEAGEELSILITITNPEKPPYRESELFGIGNYRIEDMSGNIIVSESSFAERTLFTSQMSLKVPLNQISSGKYKLVIEQFVSEKKADQPLMINGIWEADFVK